jgi:thiol-disulfide isomerase/thioredoxin
MSKSHSNLLLVIAGLAVGLGVGGLFLVGCGLGGYLIGSRVLRTVKVQNAQSSIGTTAPDFMVTSIYGDSMRLSDLSGRPIMLNFWASWCGPCVEEMPILQAFSERYSNELMILGINADEPREDVLDFVEQNELTFPMLMDPDSRIQDLYRIRAFPTSYFIDQNGIIRAVHIGTLSEALLDRYLEQIGVSE